MSSDIFQDSGCRLPLVARNSLGEAGRRIFDEAASPGRSLAGLKGPIGIWLYSQGSLPHLKGLHQYLRFDSGISPAVREIAILVVARETSCQFQWATHEGAALQAGASPTTIEVIKFRRGTESLNEQDAVVIELGRQAFGAHAVSSDIYDRALTLFGATMLVDIVLLMGTAAASSALLTIFDMQLRPGQEPPLPLL